MRTKPQTSVMAIANQRRDQLTLIETSHSTCQAGEILKTKPSELMDGTVQLKEESMILIIYSH